MAMIADSGGIYGLYDADERKHPGIRAAFRAEPGLVIIPMPILSEIDYLLRKKLGVRAELDFIDDIRSGAFALEPCLGEDLTRCAALIETYRNLDLGLADACVVAIAERLGTLRILTVDERRFRVMRTAKGKPLTLLPADA
jgi:predicted nucleic acid-binding protein